MSIYYGVLQGKADIFKREDSDDTPHLQTNVIGSNNRAWRGPVKMKKPFRAFCRRNPVLLSYSLIAFSCEIKAEQSG